MTYEEMKAKYCGTNIRRKPKDEEHKIQVSMVNWFRLQYPSMRHNLFSVPNGGRRDAVTGAKLKAEGVLPGVSEKEWEAKITADGYKYVVCRSLDDFIKVVTDYLNDV